MKIKMTKKEKIKYIALISVCIILINVLIFILIKKDQQKIGVETLPFIDKLVLYEQEEGRGIVEEQENTVSLSKTNQEKDINALIPYSKKIVKPVVDWKFNLDGLEQEIEGDFFYPKEKLPLKVDLYTEAKKNYFEIYSPETDFKVNDINFKSERYTLLKKEVSKDSVISVNLEDYLFFEESGLKKLDTSELIYKYEDIRYGVEHIVFDDKNLLKEPVKDSLYESIEEFLEESVPPLSYVERYSVELESFEPYQLSFDYQDDEKITYALRFYKKNYLERLDKLKKGEAVSDVSEDDWEKLYQEVVLESYETKDGNWHTFKKVVEPTLPDIVGVEIVVYDDEVDPKNIYKNFKLQKAKKDEFIELEHIDENLEPEFFLAKGLMVKGENQINITEEVNEKDIVINSGNIGFEKGVWHDQAFDCTINKLGDPELVEMKLSDDGYEEGNAVKLVSSTNHRACTVNTFYLKDFTENTLKVSFRAKKLSDIALLGYHYVLHGEFGDYILGEDQELEDDNYIKSGTKIYDSEVGEWTEIIDYINLNNSTINRIGNIEGITLRLNSIRDGGDDAVVLYDDINIVSVDKNLPILEDLYLEARNEFDYEDSKQLVLLNRAYSDKWGINSVDEQSHYKTGDDKNLWLGSIDKNAEIKNSYWSIGRILVVILTVLLFVFVWSIWYLESLMKLSGRVNTFIERVKERLANSYSRIRKKFLNFNKTISNKFIRPALCKFFEIKSLDYEWLIRQRERLFNEVDTVFSKIFNDLLNRPVLNLVLLILGGSSYLILGNIYYTILFIIFLFWFVNEWDSVVLAFAAMVNLCIVPVMLVLNKDIWAEKFSLLVYFFLVMTVILQVIEYVKVSSKEEQ